jgi:hypothetical protein
MPKKQYVITDSPLNLEGELAKKLSLVGQTKRSTRLGDSVKYIYAPSLEDIDTTFGEIRSQKPVYNESTLATIRQPVSHPEIKEIDDDELAGLLGNFSIGGRGGKKSRKSKTSKKSKKSRKSRKSRK